MQDCCPLPHKMCMSQKQTKKCYDSENLYMQVTGNNKNTQELDLITYNKL